MNDKILRHYAIVAERAYWFSFIFTLIVIMVASIVTAFLRYKSDINIILVPDNLLRFIEHVLWVFALPVSVKVGGESLVHAIQAFKGIGPSVGMQYGSQYSTYNSMPYNQTAYTPPFDPNNHEGVYQE